MKKGEIQRSAEEEEKVLEEILGRPLAMKYVHLTPNPEKVENVARACREGYLFHYEEDIKDERRYLAPEDNQIIT